MSIHRLITLNLARKISVQEGAKVDKVHLHKTYTLN